MTASSFDFTDVSNLSRKELFDFTRIQINSGHFEDVIKLFNHFPHLSHSPALMALFLISAKEKEDLKVEEYWNIYKWNLFESARILDSKSWAKSQTANLIWTFEKRLDKYFHDSDWLQNRVDSFLRSSRYDMTLNPQNIMLALTLAEKKLGISVSESVLLIKSTLMVRQILLLGNFSEKKSFLGDLAKSGKVHETAFRDFCICLFALSEFKILVDFIESNSKQEFRIGPSDYALIQRLNTWSSGLKSIFSKIQKIDEVHLDDNKNSEIRIVTLDPESSSAIRVISQLSGFRVICEPGVNGASLPNEFKYLLSDSPNEYKPGTLGCFLSHYSIWNDSHNSERIVVLEDDVTVQPKHMRNLILLSKEQEWDLVFINDRMSVTLNHSDEDEIVEYQLNGLDRPKAPGADGYIASKAICRELVAASELKEWKGNVDHFIINCVPRLKEMGYKVGISSIPAVLHLHSRPSMRLGLDLEK